MSISIRRSVLRGIGFAVASGALIGGPVMAAPETPVAAPTTVAQGYGTGTTTVVDAAEVESVNGWYLTVGAGAVWPGNINYWANSAPLWATSQPRGVVITNSGFSADGGIGYDFGAIRTELTFGYSAANVDSVVSRDLSRSFNADGRLNKYDTMLSAYWDVLTFSRFTPYIGGGIGYTDLATVRSSSFNAGSYVNPPYHDKGLFGWQAKVGVSYALAYNWDVYAEGTFSGTGNPQFEGVNFSSYQDVGAKLGFRYRFAKPAVVVVVPEPAPAPAPAPAPIPMPEPAPAPIRGLW
ncbi:MAG: outer membrane beta-barrel protein [Cyanobacteria bacterium]|nr:outer membrane beta-barrel protein [Cyanobacteriota bacterium]